MKKIIPQGGFFNRFATSAAVGPAVGLVQGLTVYPLDTVSARRFNKLPITFRGLWSGFTPFVFQRIAKASVQNMLFTMTGLVKDKDGNPLPPAARVALTAIPYAASNPLSVVKLRRQVSGQSLLEIFKGMSKRDLVAGLDGQISKQFIVGGTGITIFHHIRGREDGNLKLFAKAALSFSGPALTFIPIEASRVMSMNNPSLYPGAYKAFPVVIRDPRHMLMTMLPITLRTVLTGSFATVGFHYVFKAEEKA